MRLESQLGTSDLEFVNSESRISAVNIETNSFISKLLQWNSCGFHANIHFNAFGGRIYVNPGADLISKSRIKRRSGRKQQHNSSFDEAGSTCASIVSLRQMQHFNLNQLMCDKQLESARAL